MATSTHQSKVEMFASLRAQILIGVRKPESADRLRLDDTEVYYNAAMARYDLFRAINEQLGDVENVTHHASEALMDMAIKAPVNQEAAQRVSLLMSAAELSNPVEALLAIKGMESPQDRGHLIDALDLAVITAVKLAATALGLSESKLLDSLEEQIPT